MHNTCWCSFIHQSSSFKWDLNLNLTMFRWKIFIFEADKIPTALLKPCLGGCACLWSISIAQARKQSSCATYKCTFRTAQMYLVWSDSIVVWYLKMLHAIFWCCIISISCQLLARHNPKTWQVVGGEFRPQSRKLVVGLGSNSNKFVPRVVTFYRSWPKYEMPFSNVLLNSNAPGGCISWAKS